MNKIKVNKQDMSISPNMLDNRKIKNIKDY